MTRGGRGAYSSKVPVPVSFAMHLRPASLMRSDIPPDDLLCTWVYLASAGCWQLKYIHRGCRAHGKLPRSA
jgi:hypothetical protein